jgi:hypothetical protein
MNATFNIYAPGGPKGLDDWLNALEAVVARHGKGEMRNGEEIVPCQGLCGLVDSPANRATILAEKCGCEVCTAFLEVVRPVMR